MVQLTSLSGALETAEAARVLGVPLWLIALGFFAWLAMKYGPAWNDSHQKNKRLWNSMRHKHRTDREKLQNQIDDRAAGNVKRLPQRSDPKPPSTGAAKTGRRNRR